MKFNYLYLIYKEVNMEIKKNSFKVVQGFQNDVNNGIYEEYLNGEIEERDNLR